MFIYSFKASSIRFFAIIAFSVAAIITLVALIPKYEPASVYVNEEKINFNKISSNEDRIGFLRQFGWEVKSDALDEATVTIPLEFDTVYQSYNTLQEKQGLDLEKYKNKQVTRYTYEITNYPDYDGRVLANVIVYKNKVIGGDVCSADVNGFLHGFDAETVLP